MNRIFGMGARLCALGALLAGMGELANVQAAPPAANLAPRDVQSNGTWNVAVLNPSLNNGRIDKLALQVTAQGSKPVRLVHFTVEKGDDTIFERNETGAPFCLSGDRNKVCSVKQAGERWEANRRLITTGDYAVTIEVYSDVNSNPDWSGTVDFKLVSNRPVAQEPGYGTGTGNGPMAEIHDAFYSDQGMKKIKVEAKLFTQQGRPMNSRDVQFVEYRVARTSDFETVYSNIELTPPYCIFGEDADGKTCKTLSVGDTWPQSNRFAEDADGNRTGQKENDPDIPRTQIEPGEYQLSISIRTNQGSWDSNGTFTLLP